MTAAYRLRFTRRAATHLRNIYDFIEKTSPHNATETIGRITSDVNELTMMPGRHPELESIRYRGKPVHSMPVRPYLVRYHIDEANRVVTVLSVRHGARRPGL